MLQSSLIENRLRQSSNRLTFPAVSAAQIIEEIKALPPEERAQVVDFVNDLTKRPQVRYATDEEFKEAAEEVFKHHSGLLRRLAK